jgi:hypothetical protein
VSVWLATLAQARLRRRLLAYARERLCTNGKKDGFPHSKRAKRPSNLTRPPPVDGMAAGLDTFRATIGPEAFRGMVIWEIPAKRSPEGQRRLHSEAEDEEAPLRWPVAPAAHPLPFEHR